MFKTSTIFSRKFMMLMVGLVSLLIGNFGIKVNGRDKPVITSTNRPMRDRRDLVLKVGQNEGDLQGRDEISSRG